MPDNKKNASNLPVFENDDFWVKYNVIDLLNTFPIYNFYADNSKEREVVICSDTILTEQAKLFINYVLQFCQADRYQIKVTVLTENPDETRKDFLKGKPAVPKFISINNEKVDNSLGTINFVSLDQLEKVLNSQNCHYFFISFVNDNEITKITNEVRNSFKNNDDYLIASDYDNGDIDFYINEEFDFDQSLTSLALNLHLSYLDKNYTSAAEEYNRFLQEYNFLSSLLGVVSINYKLNSIGIEAESDPNHIQKTLEEFEKVKDSVTDELAYIEHRRWNIEKIFDGYDSFNEEDFKRIIKEPRTHFESEDRKIHFCVVPSVKSFPLEKIPKKDWDKYIPGEKEFDELDKVSLKVHRVLRDAALERKANENEKSQFMDKIENNLNKFSTKTQQQFNLVKHYYDQLFSFKHPQAYSNLKDSINTMVKTIKNTKARDSISQLFKELLDYLEPINRYLNPVDYKNYDKDIVENISYIFNNRFREKLGLGFQIEQNSNDRYQNVASLTVLFPSEVVYFTYLTEDDELRSLYQHFKNIADYIRRRIPDCNIKLDVLIPESVSEDAVTELSKSLADNQNNNDNYIFEIVRTEGVKEAQEWIENTIENENIKVLDSLPKIFGNENTDTDFKRSLRDKGIPQFRFDSKRGEFNYIENCSYLEYLRTDNFIINLYDIFQIGNAYMYFDVPKFSKETVRALWKLVTGVNVNDMIRNLEEYEKSVAHWNELGERLKQFDADNLSKKDLKYSLELFTNSNSSRVYDFVFEISKEQQASFLYLFDMLYKEGYLKSKPKRVEYDDQSVTFKIKTEFKNLYEALEKVKTRFGSKMKEREKLNIYTLDSNFGKKEKFVLEYNDLNVDRFEINNYGSSWYDVTRLKNILKNLNQLGLIKDLEIDGNTISFNYINIYNKDLILNSGKVLELYCYYAFCNNSLFDEIATSVNIENKETGEKNEFDLVAIKGNRAFIIECKQTKELKQSYVYKLRSLSLDYNINSRGILIANNYANGRNINRENEINKRKAIRDQIDVINDPNEIVNLVENMKKIINREDHNGIRSKTN